MNRVLYSFVVDRGATFPYQAWNLAHSLVRFWLADVGDIFVQFTPNADKHARAVFEEADFSTRALTPFGDGKYCNKLAQIENLPCEQADAVVLLDTDTIAVADLRTWVSDQTIRAKIVDFPNPPLATLQEVAALADLDGGEIGPTDSGEGESFVGNCNGGFYAIPAAFAPRLGAEWRRWANWLLAHPEPLRRVGREIHVDQVSFWLALRSTRMPFAPAPANANYFTHSASPHTSLDAAHPIALLHYHDKLDVLGKLECEPGLSIDAKTAIDRANEQIGQHFDNRLFWPLRYEQFPERGSGVGSRGENLLYKRQLLLENGIEDAETVLDIGCGDLEVVKPLKLRNYIGVDTAPLAIERGREIFPHARFILGLAPETPSADIVLCFEVLIHQHDLNAYRRVVTFAAERARHTLIISGYAASTPEIARNSMIVFHEPLAETLAKTGRFSSITEIGRHTDVTIYRCDV